MTPIAPELRGLPTYVALLRGINLGARRRIAMADLRELMRSLGHPDAVTHLQSGNIVFASAGKGVAETRAEIESGIASRFGFDVRVLIRTHAELVGIVAANPLPAAAAEPSRFMVTFLDPSPTREQIARVDPSEFLPDELCFGEGAVYAWYHGGLLGSRLTDAIWTRRMGVTATTRNWRTVTWLAGAGES